MSPARARAGRGIWPRTWKALATLIVSLSLPVSALAAVREGPESTPRTSAEPLAKEPKQPSKKKKRKHGNPTIEDLIRAEFGRYGDQAVRIAYCESKFIPTARSYAGARGVFQIMPVHSWRIARVKGKDLYDPKTNIKVARHIFDDQGWAPWSCARIVGLK